MTSKSLCFKLMREDLKRRMWTIALTVLGLVFTLLVPVALQSSAYMDGFVEESAWQTKERMARQLVGMVGVNGFVIAVLLALAVVWAVSGFRYLHSSKQVDFYHSIPVKRHQLFMASYLNGILVPMAIYLTIQILSVALILRTGIGGRTLGDVWWKMYLLNLVYFGMMYTTTVIAMMMTGNLIIALLGTAVFSGYGPAVISLTMLYKSEWFYTYYETAEQVNTWMRAVRYSSPFANYMFALRDFSDDGLGIGGILGAAAATGILAAAAYGLYRIRPSEAAGKAMAFRKTESPIKHLIALPVGVVFGMFFYSLRSTLTWSVFGVLCGTALTCCIMEIIYHFDFRRLFANWIHLGACFAISLLLVLAGMYDWYGYDSWLPDAASVESAAVVFRYDDDWITYGDVKLEKDYMGRESAGWDYMSQTEYGFSHMELTDIYTVMELGQKGVEAGKERRRQKNGSWGWIDGENCTVKFRLKNGKSAYRQYWIPSGELEPLKETVYNNREYKKGIYPVLKQTSEDTARVYFQQYNQKEEVALSGEDMAHLLAVYQKELEELTMAARKKELPMGTIQFRTRRLDEGIALNERNQYGYSLEERCYYPVYPSFVRTLEDLEKAGVEFARLDESTVSDIRIQYYWEPTKGADLSDTEDGSGALAETLGKDTDEGRTVIYDDEEDLKRLIPALVFLDYRNMNGYYEMEIPDNVDSYVTANFDISSDYRDREGSTGGFQINMKLLSDEDIQRFRLARLEEE